MANPIPQAKPLVGGLKSQGHLELDTPEGFGTLGRFLDAGGAVFNVRHPRFGARGDGITDDTAAIQAAIDAASTAGGGVVLLPPGTYLVSVPESGQNALNVTASDISLVGHHATITCPDPNEHMMLFEDVVRFSGAGREVAPVATVAADIVMRAGRITLSTSGHGLKPGDIIHIESSGELFSGVEGASGFERVNKGELLEVRKVEGADILLAGRTADSYDATNFTVSVYRCHMIRNVRVEGIRFIGAGRRAVGGMSQGQTAVRMEWFKGGVVRECEFHGMQAHAVALRYGMHARVNGCTMIGDPDIGYGDDQSTTSPYIGFYGVHAFGVQSGTVTECVGRYLRRLADMGSTSQIAIPGRHWLFSNNIAEFCWHQALGAHTGEDLEISNNIVRASGNGIGSRAKRVKIIDNLVEGGHPHPLNSTGISIGIASSEIDGNEAAWEAVNFEDCEIRGNTIIGCGRPVRWSSVGGRHVKIVDNTIVMASPNEWNPGIDIFGHTFETLEILENIVDVRMMDDSAVRGYGIDIKPWGTENGRLNTLRIENNTIISPARVGIRLAGVLNANARSEMVWAIRENVIRLDRERATLPFAHIELADGGNYGRVLLKDNDFRGRIRHHRPIYLPSDRTLFWETPVVMENSQDIGMGIGTGARRRLIVDEFTEDLTPVTVQSGDCISQPLSTGGAYERVAVSSGTLGTLAGVTGSIEAGSYTLTVNTTDGIFVGAILRIAGAGEEGGDLDARVLRIDGLDVTLAAAAGTTVVDAAVSYRTPTFRPNGIVGATRATAQPDSTAEDIATLVADFNALLAKLRSANLLGS